MLQEQVVLPAFTHKVLKTSWLLNYTKWEQGSAQKLVKWVLIDTYSSEYEPSVQISLVAITSRGLIDSFTVPLRSPNGRHLPAARAVQKDSLWGLKNGGEFPLVTWAHNAMGHKAISNLYLDQSITKVWC